MKLKLHNQDGLEENFIEVSISKEDLIKINKELEIEEVSFIEENKWGEFEDE